MRISMKKHSMLYKILWPVLILVIVQSALFAIAMLWGGTLDRMKENSLDILNERVLNRKNALETDMLMRYSNLSEAQQAINDKLFDLLQAEGKEYHDLAAGSDIGVKAINAIAGDLIYAMRKNAVTGTFVIFAGDDFQMPANGTSVQKCGFYVRDMDPLSAAADTSDLLLERAPSDTAKALGITTDIYWAPLFELNSADSYYFKPLHAAIANPDLAINNVSYWGDAMRLHADDLSVMTYSVPLKTADGKVYGVMGIEITNDYMQRLLPYSELSRETLSSYVLATGSNTNRDKMDFLPQSSTGPLYRHQFDAGTALSFDADPLYRNVYATTSANNETVLASIQHLNLYNSNTPFADDDWVLIGMESEKDLFAFSANMSATIFTIFIVSLIIGILGALFIAFNMASPVNALARKLRQSDPHLLLELPRVKVSEIDLLSASIEQMSLDIAQASSRISTIIELSGMPVGVFEYTSGDKYVHCSAMFYTLTGLTPEGSGIPSTEFDKFIHDLYLRAEHPNTRDIFVSHIGEGASARYVRVRIKDSDTARLGVMMDVSGEISEKRKLEYERDNDLLTNLLNRRAFAKMADISFADKSGIKNAALIMMDLDNLKYVNDTYGHDCGDEYIRCAANVLRSLSGEHVLSARVSGDEFQVLFHHFNSTAEIRSLIDEMRRQMLNSKMNLPDGKQFKVRASAGVAWYPRDAEDFETLTRYADFAMYEVKNSIKGDIHDFDANVYRRDSFLLHSREELNRLIDEELVDYAFQPIIKVSDGTVFAYEALMRPRLNTLKTPIEVLRLAQSQSKLYPIERLTWFCAMCTIHDLGDRLQGRKIFINSIANQILNEVDLAELTLLYGDLFPRIIAELTESEQVEKEQSDRKIALIRNLHLEIALDDFGTGYNSEMALLDLKPDYIKIDMGIVRGIDKDEKRRDMFCNLVSYSKQNGIKVLAEGVETEEEMRVLIECGAEYLQGFYLGRPSLEPEEAPAASIAALKKYKHID